MADPSENPSRFASSAHTAEDLLKSQTVGLVHLSDFRKRRAEALEQSEGGGSNGGSGASTPAGSESRYVAFLPVRRALAMREQRLTDQAQ
jgi:protein FAM50